MTTIKFWNGQGKPEPAPQVFIQWYYEHNIIIITGFFFVGLKHLGEVKP